jgi:hypothetical protein
MEDRVPDNLPAGIDPSALLWRLPNELGADWPAARADRDRPEGELEVAIAPRAGGGNWVLLRVAGDPAGRVLVYDDHEWECFLDGARRGEFG